MTNDTLFSTIDRMVAGGQLASLLGNELAGCSHFPMDADGAVGYAAYVFVLADSGVADVEINYIPFRLERGSLLMLKPYMIVTSFAPDASFSARCLFINKEFFASIPENIRFHALQNKAVNIVGVPEVKLDAVEYDEVSSVFKSVCRFVPRHSAARPMMLARLSYLLLIAVEAIRRNLEVETQTASHKDVLFQNFLQLLCCHYAEQHDLGFYARQLGVSTRYLQRVVKETTGRTVYSYISERLRIHARRLLAGSDMTVEQISFALHFSSPSAFGKFFKANCGMSPKQFREQAKMTTD